jgi:Holliday junction resolvasome RuvABC ATP-dependent DNA helicase subunit
MKLGLVRIQNEKLVGVQYFESKFQRELGEVVSINNVKWTVAVIGEDRNTIVDVLNGFVKKQNSIVRKVNNRINRIADMRFNKALREAIEHVNNYKPL